MWSWIKKDYISSSLLEPDIKNRQRAGLYVRAIGALGVADQLFMLFKQESLSKARLSHWITGVSQQADEEAGVKALLPGGCAHSIRGAATSLADLTTWLTVFTYTYPLKGHMCAGANPSWHWARGGVHPGQDPSVSTALWYLYSYSTDWILLRLLFLGMVRHNGQCWLWFTDRFGVGHHQQWDN